MLLQNKEVLSFDDVTLIPQYSDILSREEVSLKSGFFDLPIIASPMNTVTEDKMAIEMSNIGGLGIIHRYNKIVEQAFLVDKVAQRTCDVKIAAAIGVKDDYLERAKECVYSGANVISIDVAHGHHVLVKNAIETLRKEFGNSLHIMAGNVATPQGFLDLQNWGADSIRVGIAGGSICKTFVETHHGLSTLQSVLDITNFFQNRYPIQKKAKLIADGGIKTAGNIVCALAAGADWVVCGSILAGTDEAPGKIVEISGKQYKSYFGMASVEAQKMYKDKASSDEGISSYVPLKGPVRNVLQSLKTGMKSGFSYSGARTIEELQKFAIIQKQTNSSYLQGTPHILNREGTKI